TLYVTHDQVEAMTMGDRVAVLRRGELQQVAPPQELYDRPTNLFVGGFIGSPAMNLLTGIPNVRETSVEIAVGPARIAVADARLASALRSYDGREIVVGIRPEDLHGPDEPPHGASRLRGVVRLR